MKTDKYKIHFSSRFFIYFILVCYKERCQYSVPLCYSYELVPFTKLGWKHEGVWLFMLGAVTVGNVDLGLDNVVITPDRYRDMFFTLPIVNSM
jgi:hypothetical protein